MSLRELSNEEQREAFILAIEAKFRADMERIDRDHVKAMKRIDYWSAFAQGAIIGVSVMGTICFVLAALSKSHH